MRAALLTLCLTSGTALAAPTCDILAFTDWTLAEDPPIHASPSAEAPVLGHALRQQYEGEDFHFGAEVRVVEMRGGWARVEDVRNHEGTVRGPDGWIDGRLLIVKTQTEMAFELPDPSSGVIYAGEVWPFGQGVLDCRGAWVKVSFMSWREAPDETWVEDGLKIGWVRGICDVQETTCDGRFGDLRPVAPPTSP